MSMLLRIFRRPDYNSEVTQFLEQLKAANPGLEAQQKVGRSLLWDKNIDLQQADEWRQARVAPKPYVYQTENR